MNEVYGFVSVGVDENCDENFLRDRISNAVEHVRFSNKKVGQGYYSNWHVFSERSQHPDFVTSEILTFLRTKGSLFSNSTIDMHKKVSISLYEDSTSCGLVVSSELARQIGIHGFDLEVAYYQIHV